MPAHQRQDAFGGRYRPTADGGRSLGKDQQTDLTALSPVDFRTTCPGWQRWHLRRIGPRSANHAAAGALLPGTPLTDAPHSRVTV